VVQGGNFFISNRNNEAYIYMRWLCSSILGLRPMLRTRLLSGGFSFIYKFFNNLEDKSRFGTERVLEEDSSQARKRKWEEEEREQGSGIRDEGHSDSGLNSKDVRVED